MEDWFSQIDKNLPSLSLGAGVPAVNVAETDKAIEITGNSPAWKRRTLTSTCRATN